MHYTSDEDFLSESGDSSVSYREEIEFEEPEEVDPNSNEVKSNLEERPYSEEPLADDQWMEEYSRERKLTEERQQELQNQLERVVESNIWLVSRHLVLFLHCKCVILLHMNTTFASVLIFFRCKCGNCCVDVLQNAMECQCCHEIEGCVQSLSSDLVLLELDSLSRWAFCLRMLIR